MAAPRQHAYISRLIARASKPEAYAGVLPQVNLCMEEIGKDVSQWERKWWCGNDCRRFGSHIEEHLAWGSSLLLGDTFPPGATL